MLIKIALDLATVFIKLSWYFYWKGTDHKYEGVSILLIYVYPYTSVIKSFLKNCKNPALFSFSYIDI